MADNMKLQFKMGEWTESFDSMAKVPGTVYVTTNEEAMYVDVSKDKRIRIGDIIQVESARVAKPPFSTKALYYFIEENALLKWGPFGVDAEGNSTGEMAWKQLNSVSDVTANLDKIEARVADAETDIADLVKELDGVEGGDAGLKARVATLESEMDAVEDVASNAKSTADAAAEAIGTTNDNASATGTLYARIKQNAADIVAAEELIGENNSAIANLNTVVKGADGNSGLVKTVSDLGTTTSGIRTDLGTKSDTKSDDTAFGKIALVASDLDTAEGDISNLKGRVDTLEEDYSELNGIVAGHTNTIAELQAAVGTGAEGLATKVSDLQRRMTTAETDIEAVEGDITTINGQITALQDEDTQIKKDVAQNVSDIATVSGVANAAKTAIGDANSGLIKDVADLKAKDTAIENAATALTGRVSDLEKTTSTLNTELGSIKSDISENTAAIAKLNGGEDESGSVANQIKIVKKALQDEIDSDINAANAMNYIDSVKAYSELPTSGVHIGDTYVVSAGFTYNGDTYYAGDLLVAKGTETNGVITSDVEWNHVETGYIVEHEAKLAGANNAITLTSHTATGGTVGDLGTIAFAAAAGSSATVEVTDNQVTIGMEWGTF